MTLSPLITAASYLISDEWKLTRELSGTFNRNYYHLTSKGILQVPGQFCYVEMASITTCMFWWSINSSLDKWNTSVHRCIRYLPPPAVFLLEQLAYQVPSRLLLLHFMLNLIAKSTICFLWSRTTDENEWREIKELRHTYFERQYLYASYRSFAMKMCTVHKVDQNFLHLPEYHKKNGLYLFIKIYKTLGLQEAMTFVLGLGHMKLIYRDFIICPRRITRLATIWLKLVCFIWCKTLKNS